MFKSILTLLITAMLMPSLSAFAGDPEAYVIFKNGTLTFKYDDQKPESGAFGMNTVNAHPAWVDKNSQVSKVVFDASFASYQPVSCREWFSGCLNLTTIQGIANLKTDKVATMYDMFRNCSKLTSIDLSRFNTPSVTSLNGMFKDCSSLTQLDLTTFNTSKVDNMNSMFENCSNLKIIYISDKWSYASNPSYVDILKDSPAKMTIDDREAYVVFSNGTLSFKYDGEKPESGAYELNSVSAHPGWVDKNSQVTKVVFDASFIYVEPISCKEWFSGCQNLSTIQGIANLKTNKVTTMMDMFCNCSKLTSIDFSHFNTESVENMSGMFKYCTSLSELNLTSFNTSEVYTMQGMFDGCSNLRTIMVSDDWTTTSVTHSESMFSDCNKLKGYKGTTYNAANVDKTYAHIDKGSSDPGYLSIKLELISVEITTQPTKTEYIVGQELDLSDGILTAKFDDGSKTTISLANLDVSGFDSQTVGQQTITVSYKGMEASFTVKVIERVAESITIDPLPTKTEYIKGEALDLTGGKLVITFNDQSTQTIDLAEATVSGFDSQNVAEQTITVKYNELTSTFSVTVKDEPQSENPPTPISETPDNQDNVKVWSCSNTIYIQSAPDTKYKIIDLNGRTLTTSTTKSTREEITVNTHNIVLVLVDGKSYKVYVK